jgi:hypothetical protein
MGEVTTSHTPVFDDTAAASEQPDDAQAEDGEVAEDGTEDTADEAQADDAE